MVSPRMLMWISRASNRSWTPPGAPPGKRRPVRWPERAAGGGTAKPSRAAPSQMVSHVLHSFATAANLTLHARQLAGANDHHIAEATMKALGRALDKATALDPRIAGQVPSTKDTLTA